MPGLARNMTPYWGTTHSPHSQNIETATDPTLLAPSSPVTNTSVSPPGNEKAAFTITEAGKYAGLSRSFIYSLFEQKRLPRLKAGKRVLILKSDLDAYLQALRDEGT